VPRLVIAYLAVGAEQAGLMDAEGPRRNLWPPLLLTRGISTLRGQCEAAEPPRARATGDCPRSL
jgi:hypothetical protein